MGKGNLRAHRRVGGEAVKRAGITEDVMMDTSPEPTINEGDLVLIYIDERRKFIVRARKGLKFTSDRGVLDFDEVIGKPYGSTVVLSTGAKAWLLKPLPYDVMDKGFRRPTQVIYPKDIGYMIVMSGVKPGSKVLEAGAGSGFLTAMLALHVMPTGKVISYEVRENIYKVARRNLELLGVIDYVDLRLGDVRQGVDEKRFDAAFLDMPDPWNALQSVHSALKPSAPLVVFVPTYNQVEKTCLAMEKHGGFVDIRAVEIMLRELQVKEGAVRPKPTMIAHTGFIIMARKVIVGEGEGSS